MDSGKVTTGGMEKGADSSLKSAELDCLAPITPDPDRENVDSFLAFESPLTVIPSPLQVTRSDSHSYDQSPRTPKENVFDPFAPGPEELALAPNCKKNMRDSRNNVARFLDFGSSLEFAGIESHGNNGESSLDEDEMLLESVYKNLLEAIVCNEIQTDCNVEKSPIKPICDGLRTPPSAPRLTGIAETCPNAPRKDRPKKQRNIDQGLCRKLEF